MRSGMVLAIAFVLRSTFAFAQFDTATVIGSVTDSDEASVPGATVTARHTNSGFTRWTTTDADGRFRLAALSPGSYELRTELQGFRPAVRTGVTLMAGSESIIDFSMTPGSVNETVVVTAEVPVVETTSASIAVAMTRREIEALPVLSRNYVELVRQAPTAALNNGS